MYMLSVVCVRVLTHVYYAFDNYSMIDSWTDFCTVFVSGSVPMLFIYEE